MYNKIENDFFSLVINRKMYSNKSNLKFRLNYIFKNIELENKTVLDVGGGVGLLTFFAAVKGAKKVVCLEPECDGSSSKMIEKFNELKSSLFLNLPIEHVPLTLQDYVKQFDEEYDVIVLHNSINHLDEEACINFLKSQRSFDTYKRIFKEVYNRIKIGGNLIVADCSCNNFWHAIGLKSYFNPTIEWHKHQKPEIWIALLKEIGFINPKVTWSSPNTFGNAGRVLMGNFLMSYLTTSHFKITMEK